MPAMVDSGWNSKVGGGFRFHVLCAIKRFQLKKALQNLRSMGHARPGCDHLIGKGRRE